MPINKGNVPFPTLNFIKIGMIRTWGLLSPFLEGGVQKAIITSPENVLKAVC